MKLFIELRGLIQCTKLHDHAVCYIQSRRRHIDAFIILGRKEDLALNCEMFSLRFITLVITLSYHCHQHLPLKQTIHVTVSTTTGKWITMVTVSSELLHTPVSLHGDIYIRRLHPLITYKWWSQDWLESNSVCKFGFCHFKAWQHRWLELNFGDSHTQRMMSLKKCYLLQVKLSI